MWSPRAPVRAAPPKKTTRSQKVGDSEGEGVKEKILARLMFFILVELWGFWRSDHKSVSAAFYRPEKGRRGLSEGVVAPFLTQITPSAAEPPPRRPRYLHNSHSSVYFDSPLLVEFLRFFSRPLLMTGCSCSSYM